MVKNPPANAGDITRHNETRVRSWVATISWRKAWQSAPIFLPAESPGQRSVAGYSPQGRKELDMIEAT